MLVRLPDVMGVGYGTCAICKALDYCYKDRIAGTLCIRCLTRAERILITCARTARVIKGAKLVKTGRHPADYLKRLRENKANLRLVRKAAYNAGVDMTTGKPGAVCPKCGTIICTHNKPAPLPDNDQIEIPF